MPLLDHFHPPLSRTRHWEALHARWATAMADALNDDLLPAGYFAEAPVHAGRVEIDVATFDEGGNGGRAPTATATSGGVAARVWVPPQPAFVWPAVFPEYVEVLIYHEEGGPTLVGAVEVVSPGNKDRPETRRAFAAKCAAYLHAGIGLLVVDVVTSRQANLHDELVDLLGAPGETRLPDNTAIYCVAYRPRRRKDREEIEIWRERLEIGRELPQMPLPLNKGLCLPLDLEATYAEACRRIRLPS